MNNIFNHYVVINKKRLFHHICSFARDFVDKQKVKANFNKNYVITVKELIRYLHRYQTSGNNFSFSYSTNVDAFSGSLFDDNSVFYRLNCSNDFDLMDNIILRELEKQNLLHPPTLFFKLIKRWFI